MITKRWDELLKDEYNKPYFKKLEDDIRYEYKIHTVYPKASDVFNAFRYTSYDDIKVVIIGQDPYHGENEAMGLSFSVNDGIRKPPSLQNIYKELNDDLGCPIVESGNLKKWAMQGVFLLNAILTVEKDKPLSHKKYDWEKFTDAVISKINEKETVENNLFPTVSFLYRQILSPFIFLLLSQSCLLLSLSLFQTSHKS